MPSYENRGKSLFYRIFRFLEILKIIAVVSAEGFSESVYRPRYGARRRQWF